MQPLSLRLEEDFAEELRQEAEDCGMPLSVYLRQILRDRDPDTLNPAVEDALGELRERIDAVEERLDEVDGPGAESDGVETSVSEPDAEGDDVEDDEAPRETPEVPVDEEAPATGGQSGGTPSVPSEPLAETLTGESVDLNDVLPGGGERLEAQRDALEATLSVLVASGTADAEALRERVFPDHPAGYRSAERWWIDSIRPALTEIASSTDALDAPDETGGRWSVHPTVTLSDPQVSSAKDVSSR
ncbi:hypothetical protein JCM17823_14540 [Halorubrum gandharaense]